MTEINANIAAALFDFEAAPVNHALILTYTFDPEFFGDTVAPQLGQLRCERALVLMDNRQSYSMHRDPLVGGGRTIFERFPNRLFHPKLYLLTADSRYRCLIGSANCTRVGWEENAELFTVLTETSGCTEGLIQFLQSIRSDLRPGSLASLIIADTLDDLKAAHAADPGKSRIEFLFSGRSPNGSPRRIWNDIEAALDRDQPSEIWVVSPFFESPEYFETGLLQELVGKRGLNVRIYFQNDAKVSRLPRDPILSLIREYPGKIRLYNVMTNGRKLHGKLLAIVCKNKIQVLSGSANFTAQAMRGDNIEVALWMTLPRGPASNLLESLVAGSTIVEPDELVQPVAIPLPEPDSTLRDFIARISLSLKDDRLKIELDSDKVHLGQGLSPQVKFGELMVTGFVADVETNSITISPIRVHFTQADGTLRFSPVVVSFESPRAMDWKYPDVTDSELPSWGGHARTISFERFEDFILFLPRRRSWTTSTGFSTNFGDAPDSVYRLELDDIEGQLDRFYRLFARAVYYFEQEIQNPFATYRWRGDLTRLWQLARTDAQINRTELVFLAVELLALLEKCYLRKVKALRPALRAEALASVHRDTQLQVMVTDMETILGDRDSFPSGTKLEIKRSLRTVADLRPVPEVPDGTR